MRRGRHRIKDGDVDDEGLELLLAFALGLLGGQRQSIRLTRHDSIEDFHGTTRCRPTSPRARGTAVCLGCNVAARLKIE